MYPPPKTDDVNELRQWCEEFYDYMYRTGESHRWWDDLGSITWQNVIDTLSN